MDRYIIGSQIGKGEFGVCFAATKKDDVSGTKYAIKRLNERFEDWASVEAQREFQAMLHLSQTSPYLIQTYEILREPDSTLYYVMEKMDFDLLIYMNNLKEQNVHGASPSLAISGVDGTTIRSILFQTLHGLDAIHSRNYLHRDVKPENLLLRQRGISLEVRLADFSLTRSLEVETNDGRTAFSGYIASRWYRAPEVLLELKYGQPVDMWALGCVACEMCMLEPIFQGKNDPDQLRLISAILGPIDLSDSGAPTKGSLNSSNDSDDCSGSHDRLSLALPSTDETTKRFISKLLQLEPSKRITSAQALEDDYFSPSVVNPATMIQSWSSQTLQSPSLAQYTPRQTPDPSAQVDTNSYNETPSMPPPHQQTPKPYEHSTGSSPSQLGGQQGEAPIANYSPNMDEWQQQRRHDSYHHPVQQHLSNTPMMSEMSASQLFKIDE